MQGLNDCFALKSVTLFLIKATFRLENTFNFR
jgi:hypothetical protein